LADTNHLPVLEATQICRIAGCRTARSSIRKAPAASGLRPSLLRRLFEDAAEHFAKLRDDALQLADIIVESVQLVAA
jgi:hypothetical protein